MRRAETVGALILLFFSLSMILEALRLPIGWSARAGSGFFPFWLSVGVALTALVLVVQSALAPVTAAGSEPFIPRAAFKSVLIALLPMVAVIALVDYLGLYLGGALYLAGYMRLVGRSRWPVVALVSILVPLTLFFIFEQWFRMLLPKGEILEYFLYRR